MSDSIKANKTSSILSALTFQQPSEKQDKAGNSDVGCLKCTKLFKFPEHQEDYLAHLFLAHRLVIADVSEISILEEYVNFWKGEFAQHEFEEYCTTMLLDQLPDGTPSKNEKYYLLSDVVPKDYELRVKLKEEHLERVLTQHQLELTDRSFSRECLYCRDVITGLRSLYLEHLFNKHFLQLGKPANLVYIDELIAKVQHNLDNFICLYCEKVFKDRVTLKEHMRKKAHKRINPGNKTYDKYFLENYKLQTRNPQKHQQKSRQGVRHQPTGHRNRSSSLHTTDSVDFEQRVVHKSEDSDSDWSDWNGDDETLQTLTCLFCEKQSKDLSHFKQHLLQDHTVDFDESVKDLSFYQKIKIINYIRRQICLLCCVTCNQRFESRESLLEHLKKNAHFGIGTQKQWDKPEYFFPTYEDDALLCILDDNANDDMDDTVVRIISEDPVAQINKDAERLSLENFNFL